jgi:hypothetical protein
MSTIGLKAEADKATPMIQGRMLPVITNGDCGGTGRNSRSFAKAGEQMHYPAMNQHQEVMINYFQHEDGMCNAEVPTIHGCVAWALTNSRAVECRKS